VLEDTVQKRQAASPGIPGEMPGARPRPTNAAGQRTGRLLLCALGLVACVLLTVTPLTRVPDSVIHLQLAPGAFLAAAGNWLPVHLGAFSQANSAALELFALLLLAFLCYGLGALLVSRQSESSSQTVTRGLIWAVTLLAGTIFIVTPAMLSHDILVYAGYSRLLAIYHANPYFVPIAAFPHDPFSSINYWGRFVSAYGPIWMLVCTCFGWLLQPDPNAYVVAFRLLALLVHLLNTWLVGRTLRALGRSPRTVTLGMLFYAWNPLLLLESALGGHNDGLMMTFVLLGALLAADAERRDALLRSRGYLPAAAAFALAALVKFTALPILAVYLLLLCCKALRPTAGSPHELRLAVRNWRAALLALAGSILVALLLALIFYGPFWLGHSFEQIRASFQNPPSALGAENSFMRSVIEWLHLHPAYTQNGLLQLLSTRRLWDDLSFAVIALCLLVGAFQLWSRPTLRTFVIVSLLTMCAVLLITPWFFSWYLAWPLGLAAIGLPFRQKRVEAALLALTIVFSISALFTYLFTLGLFGSHYYLVSLFTTIPPACAFLLTLVWWQPGSTQTTGEI